MGVVDLRYARALDEVVMEQQLARDQVKGQLEAFVGTMEGSPQLREVLGDPSIAQAQKVKVLDAIAFRAGLSGTVRNFLAVVTSHERLHELREIVDSYYKMADKDAGVAEAEVTSARALDDAGRQAIEASIAKLTGDTRVRATYREDPSLMGGAVVKIGSTVYDGSVRGQLEQMKERLYAAAL